MAPTTCLCIGFLLLLGHGSMAQLQPKRRRSSGLSFGQAAAASSSSATGCEFAFDRLQPLHPLQKLRAEAGTVEYFNDANQQFACAGVFFIRVIVGYRGLVLPRFTNGGALTFAVQGRGVVGVTFPGCPETPYSRFTQGDIIAVPPGVPVWIYNDGGNTPLVILVLFTTSGMANQLEPKHGDSNLAGSNGNRSKSIFDGFTAKSLSKSLRISQFLATRLQGPTDQRGTVVRVPAGLLPVQLNLNATVAVPFQGTSDEEKMCGMKVTMKLEKPRPQEITLLTGQEFPTLNFVGLSISRGALKPNAAIVSPVYTSNAQSVVYVIRGSFRQLQVVDDRGVALFDGVLRQGQPLVIPQYYVALAQAGKDGAQYVVFRTDANPVISYIAGRGSVLRGLPVDVIAAVYNVSINDAMKIKYSGGN
ncbi:unnamed protein product [Urochloa humidicola]